MTRAADHAHSELLFEHLQQWSLKASTHQVDVGGVVNWLDSMVHGDKCNILQYVTRQNHQITHTIAVP